MNFEDLVWLFTSDNRNRGIVRLNFDEAGLLWRTVRHTRGSILEIGRRHGGSTVMILAAADNRPVTSIDLAPAHHPLAEQFFQRPEVAARLRLIVGDSRQPLNDCFGCAFIDGDHSYEGVRDDVLAHWNNVQASPDGPALIAFHDAVPNPGLHWASEINHCPGVAQLCDQLCSGGYAVIEETAGSMLTVRKIRDLDEAFLRRIHTSAETARPSQ